MADGLGSERFAQSYVGDGQCCLPGKSRLERKFRLVQFRCRIGRVEMQDAQRFALRHNREAQACILYAGRVITRCRQISSQHPVRVPSPQRPARSWFKYGLTTNRAVADAAIAASNESTTVGRW